MNILLEIFSFLDDGDICLIYYVDKVLNFILDNNEVSIILVELK